MSLSSTGPVAAEMIRRLEAALNPTTLDLENQSHHHVGHAGHDGSGESHFALTIASPLFEGQNRVQRQRAIYAALGELMVDKVHALSIKALAPGE
ncbi:BolA family protein [Sphingomonas jaspsi]|uniref:BolA family protein n=1 Tax=Sphingomonas jaspsi TaxID=392409 RepID=UPI0004B7716B|nr:BolA family protein [Sphingomonas jaspsi]